MVNHRHMRERFVEHPSGRREMPHERRAAPRLRRARDKRGNQFGLRLGVCVPRCRNELREQCVEIGDVV